LEEANNTPATVVGLKQAVSDDTALIALNMLPVVLHSHPSGLLFKFLK
jgi:hypothetical protein